MPLLLAALITTTGPSGGDQAHSALVQQVEAAGTGIPAIEAPVQAPTDGGPDRVAAYGGGVAARVHRAGGKRVPGDLYLLLATVGSDTPARVYSRTPFTHDRGPHDDTIESNARAVAAAEAITDVTVEPVEFTSAPGGGPSAGLTYLIAYLNLVSDGAFTDDVVVAATGELADEGYIEHIKGATEKIAAAHLADADVLFTSAAPSHAAVDAHAERHVGQRFGSRVGRVAIEVERDLHEYASWGATAPEGLDVVVVGHVADVAAYLCGAGSVYACSIRSRLADTVTTDELTEFDRVRLSANSTSTPEAPEAHTDVDFPR